jgi:hypothetical protein
MLIAYRQGEEVPTKEKLRLARALKLKEKRDQEAAELLEFRQALDVKLSVAYEKNKAKYFAREAKLDAKEDKKRQKDLAKKNRKNNSKE